MLLIGVHFWRIRKDGGLSRPEGGPAGGAGEVPRGAPGKLEGLAPLAKTEKTKTFGVMGIVRGPFTKVGKTPDNTVYSWPNLFVAELFCFALTVLVILVLALLFNAPLEAPAEPHASAEPVEGALVLPGPAGDGLLLGLLGRRRGPDDLRRSCSSSFPTSTAATRGSASGSRATGSCRSRRLHDASSS